MLYEAMIHILGYRRWRWHLILINLFTRVSAARGDFATDRLPGERYKIHNDQNLKKKDNPVPRLDARSKTPPNAANSFSVFVTYRVFPT